MEADHGNPPAVIATRKRLDFLKERVRLRIRTLLLQIMGTNRGPISIGDISGFSDFVAAGRMVGVLRKGTAFYYSRDVQRIRTILGGDLCRQAHPVCKEFGRFPCPEHARGPIPEIAPTDFFSHALSTSGFFHRGLPDVRRFRSIARSGKR